MTQPAEDRPAAEDLAGAEGSLGWRSRWRQRIRQRRSADVVYRTVIFVLGWLIVAAGLAMLVLPGPGWAAIFVGLAVLATEYAWAHSLMTSAKDRAVRARQRAMSPEHRRLTMSLGVLVAVAAAALAYWYVEAYGLTLDGPRAWF